MREIEEGAETRKDKLKSGINAVLASNKLCALKKNLAALTNSRGD